MHKELNLHAIKIFTLKITINNLVYFKFTKTVGFLILSVDTSSTILIIVN